MLENSEVLKVERLETPFLVTLVKYSKKYLLKIAEIDKKYC